MLWYIVAAKGNFAAIVRKGDEEQLYFSYGPRYVPGAPREEDLELLSEMGAHSIIANGQYIQHSPPLAVEEFVQWPEVAVKNDRPLKLTAFY